MPKTAAKFNVYETVTETIVNAVKAGTLPWQKPWTGGAGLALPLRGCGTPYRGINVILLWCAAEAAGYASPRWMTYRQAQALGGQVRKGERSTTIIKYGTFEVGEEGAGKCAPISQPQNGATGSNTEPETRMYARAYRVFNVVQIDGLDPHYYVPAEAPRDLGTKRDADLDAWFARLGIEIRETAEPRAYYRPATDEIHMPDIATFKSTAAFYSVLGHEGAHAIANHRRLDLEFAAQEKAGAYALEEVYAQLTSAMICTHLGIAPQTEMDAAYIKHWLDVCGSGPRAIFGLASKAQAATDWMLVRAGSATISSTDTTLIEVSKAFSGNNESRGVAIAFEPQV
jgi:antirestriction protein ArdC